MNCKFQFNKRDDLHPNAHYVCSSSVFFAGEAIPRYLLLMHDKPGQPLMQNLLTLCRTARPTSRRDTNGGSIKQISNFVSVFAVNPAAPYHVIYAYISLDVRAISLCGKQGNDGGLAESHAANHCG